MNQAPVRYVNGRATKDSADYGRDASGGRVARGDDDGQPRDEVAGWKISTRARELPQALARGGLGVRALLYSWRTRNLEMGILILGFLLRVTVGLIFFNKTSKIIG